MIYRVIHNKNYTVINNTICKDKRLSWKAKGIWLYAFSRPDDWIFHLDDLINQSTDGRDSVKGGLIELEKAGYLKRDQIRQVEGKFGNANWTFYEMPFETEKPLTEKPLTGFPLTANRPLLSTDVLPSIEKQQQPAEPAAVAVVFFECLKDVQITDADKLWLTRNHTEPVVSQAIKWATNPLTKINTTLSQAIKWACKEKPDVPVQKVDLEAENKAFAFSLIKMVKASHIYQFSALNTYAEITITCSQAEPICIEYSENGFKDKLTSALRKYGLID